MCNNNFLTEYHTQYDNYKNILKNWQFARCVYVFLKLFYVVILGCSILMRRFYLQGKIDVLFTNLHILGNYKDTIENIYVFIFSGAIGLAICGLWALLIKIIFRFVKNSLMKKLPQLIEQRKLLLLSKNTTIDSFKKKDGTTLVRPYQQCPYPAQLKNSWKEWEKVICQEEIYLFSDAVNQFQTFPLLWFIVCLTLVIFTILITVAIIVAILFFTIAVLFICLIAPGIVNTPSSYYDRYDPFEEKVQDSYIPNYIEKSNNKENCNSKEINKHAEARKRVSKAKKEIKEIKKLLSQWGLELFEI